MSTVYSLGLGHSLHPPAVEAEGLGGQEKAAGGLRPSALQAKGGHKQPPAHGVGVLGGRHQGLASPAWAGVRSRAAPSGCGGTGGAQTPQSHLPPP